MAFASSNGSAVAELGVLWITAGLGCDGDTIAMTAATQPSREDVVTGQIPVLGCLYFKFPRKVSTGWWSSWVS